MHTVLYKVEESCGHCERGRTKFVLLSHDLVELNWFIFFFFLTDVLFKHAHVRFSLAGKTQDIPATRSFSVIKK